jgi:DNA-3-methyladenine glycosylase II
MQIFEYGRNEIEYLKSRDKLLGAAIDRVGTIERAVISDPFTALVLSIVSQQISKKAAETVKGRLFSLLGKITPENIERLDLKDIQLCGMSERKAGYIKGIARAALSGEVDFAGLHEMPDERVIKILSSLHGVGTWTAEMILIFSLCRPDIVSYRDLAICRGMMNLYSIKELPREKFEKYRRRYSPYGSVASLYLWAISAL